MVSGDGTHVALLAIDRPARMGLPTLDLPLFCTSARDIYAGSHHKLDRRKRDLSRFCARGQGVDVRALSPGPQRRPALATVITWAELFRDLRRLEAPAAYRPAAAL